jgi:hypothetical protein
MRREAHTLSRRSGLYLRRRGRSDLRPETLFSAARPDEDDVRREDARKVERCLHLRKNRVPCRSCFARNAWGLFKTRLAAVARTREEYG